MTGEELPDSTGQCAARKGGGISTESATENKPPARVRVKRCGKSAPRVWQQTRQGKPRTEQGQAGPHVARVRDQVGRLE